jgi:hypothetical protein
VRHGAQVTHCVLILSATTAIPPDRTGPGAPGPGRQKRELAFSEAERPLSLSLIHRGERKRRQCRGVLVDREVNNMTWRMINR